MKRQLYFSRADQDSIEVLSEIFRTGIFFVERVSDQHWLTPYADEWTNDPNKAMKWRTKPMAELEIIRLKLDPILYIVTEHEFPITPSPEQNTL